MIPDQLVLNDLEDPLDWSSSFSIDATSGSVTVSSMVDRLAGRILSYQVKATDRNGSGLSASLHLSVIQRKSVCNLINYYY